jgi:hypothetical protein
MDRGSAEPCRLCTARQTRAAIDLWRATYDQMGYTAESATGAQQLPDRGR